MKCLSLTALFLFGVGYAAEPPFAADPDQLWNRLRHGLYSRSTPDGKSYEYEGLDPAFVPQSRFLTDGPTYGAALAILDQFLDGRAERLVTDPVKRAVLQRDLWAVVATTADPNLDRQPQRRELQKRLAQVMRRVALTADEIKQLPDNLAAAVAARTFPRAYDSAHPDRPFLPVDLLQPDGPWVIVRSRLRADELAAPTHAEATGGRSAFLILLRLPEGRWATEDYLKRLEAVGEDQEIPQFPAGTQVALLRRTLLIDTTGTLRPTSLTEGLQLRVYQKLTAPDLYEFSLHRADLFAGRSGGLHPTAADESNIFDLGVLGLSPRGRQDPLESKERDPQSTPIVMKSCVGCHAGPGIFGFQSMFVDHFHRPPLGASTATDQQSAAIERTRKTYAWGLLQGLWETGVGR
jgi:hypothetical protein